ncbi:MAG: hypothetical protein ACXWDI_07980 [Nocardioides sp.]
MDVGDFNEDPIQQLWIFLLDVWFGTVVDSEQHQWSWASEREWLNVAWIQMLALLGKTGPAAAKQLPRLWPLLLETKNRERVMEAAKDVASQSPKRRLRGRIEFTAAIADDIAAHPDSSDVDKRLAEDWARRARNLSRRLDMPVVGRQEKSEHRRSLREQLKSLQAEMNAHLGNEQV